MGQAYFGISQQFNVARALAVRGSNRSCGGFEPGSAVAGSARCALGQGTASPIPALPFPLQLCDLGEPSVLSFPVCDGTWSFILSQASGFWEEERGPQRGGSSVRGPREKSLPPCLVLILLPLLLVTVALLGPLVLCPRPVPW